MKKKRVDKNKEDNVISEKRKMNKEKLYKVGLIILLVVLVSVLSFITISDEFRDMSDDEEIVDEMEDKSNINYIDCASSTYQSDEEGDKKIKEADDLLKSIGLDFFISLNGSYFFDWYNKNFKSIVALTNVPKDYIVKNLPCDTLYSDEELVAMKYKSFTCEKTADIIHYDIANAFYKKIYQGDIPKDDLFFYSGFYDYSPEDNDFIKLDGSDCKSFIGPGTPPVYVIKSVENYTHYNDEDTKKIQIYFIDYEIKYHEENPYQYDVYFNNVMLEGIAYLEKELKEKGLLQYAPVYEFGFVKKDGKFVFDYLEKK